MATVLFQEEEEALEANASADTSPLALLQEIAATEGDISGLLDEQKLTALGAKVVEDYERDLTDRQTWQDKVETALKIAAQETKDAKDYPFQGASNVKYPILTIAATEFNARAYPAICKGDETVQVKVIGSDKGRPMIGPDGQQALIVEGQPMLASAFAMAAAQAEAADQPVPPAELAWINPPGAKTKRANRVKDYLNVVLNYRMEDWEEDTDTLLYQLPIVGCGFRKVWWGKKSLPESAYVPALHLVVPMGAKSLGTAPRFTEEMHDAYPHQIRQRMALGEYRTVELPAVDEDDQAPRLLLEQYRLEDLDGDGIDEPYIVTVDKETTQVLKIEANFSPEDIEIEGDAVATIMAGRFYVKYSFLPHPEGKFYSIGFGHLLAELNEIINTTINQMIDAGHAEIAGGGFISSGLRLQGNGQTNTLRWRPGEYKVVNASAQALRDSIWERTFPQPSQVMFSVLDLMLGAAKDVAAIKDVISGDASNNGQVGTTLALIEQGLQVFNAIYKRVFRAEKEEFGLIYKLIGRYGDQKTAEDYLNVLDDDEADLQADFNAADMNIRPVSDPGSVTRIQKMSRAQFIAQNGRGNPLYDQREVEKRVLEAADVEDIDKLLPEPSGEPDPMAIATLEKTVSEADKNTAQAENYRAQAAAKGAETGLKLGEAEGASDARGIPSMEGSPDNPMGAEVAEPGGGSPEGGMGQSIMGPGPI